MKKLYDKINGKEVYLYTIKNGNIEVDICEVGARINALRVNGVDIVLGFNSVEDYNKSGCYAGATVGRVANRIAKGGAQNSHYAQANKSKLSTSENSLRNVTFRLYRRQGRAKAAGQAAVLCPRVQ